MISFQLPFIRYWHPVLALRYLPMVKVINHHHYDTIAEIGSGGLGIGPYLKRPFIGIDLHFDKPQAMELRPVTGSGLKVPLKTQSIDCVISSDMLEHLPASLRVDAINELFRLAKRAIIIGVPTGKAAAAEDKVLDELYRLNHHQPHPFLAEHVTHGLPEVTTMVNLIATAATAAHTTYRLEIIPNQYLPLRHWLMLGWVSQNLLVNIFFRKILLLAIPLMRLCNMSPVYRHIFVIYLDSNT